MGLYEEPERPANAADYLKRSMGAGLAADVDAARAENEALRARVAALEAQLRDRESAAIAAPTAEAAAE